MVDRLSEKLKETAGGDEVPKEPQIGYDNLKKSALESKDDFFEKASRYADGDYHAFNPNADQPQIVPSEDVTSEDKKPFQGTIAGFEDHDGDGDPLIDDAIIEEDDDPK